MKQIHYFSIICVTLFSFSPCQTSDPFCLINHINKLKLEYEDEKCGEWGGDDSKIIFYRDNLQGQLYADYSQKIRNCDDPYGKPLRIILKNRIEVLPEEQELILSAINQLILAKLSNCAIISNSGKYCEVSLSDSTLLIKDYPSINWTNFILLREKLTNK